MCLSMVGTGSAVAALVLHGWLAAGMLYVAVLGLIWVIITRLVTHQADGAAMPQMVIRARPPSPRPLAVPSVSRTTLHTRDRRVSRSR